MDIEEKHQWIEIYKGQWREQVTDQTCEITIKYETKIIMLIFLMLLLCKNSLGKIFQYICINQSILKYFLVR